VVRGNVEDQCRLSLLGAADDIRVQRQSICGNCLGSESAEQLLRQARLQSPPNGMNVKKFEHSTVAFKVTDVVFEIELGSQSSSISLA
jgi:hypothetical protein